MTRWYDLSDTKLAGASHHHREHREHRSSSSSNNCKPQPECPPLCPPPRPTVTGTIVFTTTFTGTPVSAVTAAIASVQSCPPCSVYAAVGTPTFGATTSTVPILLTFTGVNCAGCRFVTATAITSGDSIVSVTPPVACPSTTITVSVPTPAVASTTTHVITFTGVPIGGTGYPYPCPSFCPPPPGTCSSCSTCAGTFFG